VILPCPLITGSVPNIRAEISPASSASLPPIGSRLRLMILEAAAIGKPIVSTRLGSDRLNSTDGENIVLADEAQTFARAVAELLRHAPRRRCLGLAGRRRVEREYNCPVLQASVREALALA